MMKKKDVNILNVGSDKVVQHIQDISKKCNNKNVKENFINSKLTDSITDYDNTLVDDSSHIVDKNSLKSQTFITVQSDLKGSDLFGFKMTKNQSFRKRASSSAKKLVPELKEKSTSSSDGDTSPTKDHKEKCKRPTHKKLAIGSKNKAADKLLLDTAVIEEFFEEEKFSIKTSDRTLSRLPKLDPLELERILLEYEFPYEHERKDLSLSYSKYFKEWMLYMKYGSNILLYGLGSKINILNKFAEQFLADFLLIVVNGFFPSLTLKSIFSGICDLIEIQLGNLTSFQLCDLIQNYLDQNDEDLFIVLHNIDSPSLRNEKMQNDLSYLAQIKRIHLIASIDHINAPLLWDQTKLNRFSFLWYDVTTFENYIYETSYENSLLITCSGALQLTSLAHILSSLTENAKKIFHILATNQMEFSGDANFQGYAFEDLYVKCREEFLVNCEATLRAQISEFVDHKLIRIKKGLDGVELVHIMLDDSNLSLYLENQEDMN